MSKPRVLAGIASIAFVLAIAATGPVANAAPPTVGLGTATSFAVLAGTGITNTGPSVVNGDIGSFPTTTISGFPPGIVTPGNTNHGGDGVTQGAKSDLITAYNDAAGRTPVTTVPTELGGTTKTAGIYTSAAGTFGITGSLTLDGAGDPTSVFIFQMASTLTTATGSSVVLTGGAQSCNVFWQVGSSATLGTSTSFIGNVLALTSITLVTGTTVDGRLLARDGAVTLDTNTITPSTCAAAVPTPVPTVAPTTTPTVAPTATAPVTVVPTATTTPVAPVVTGAPSAPPTAITTIEPAATPIPVGMIIIPAPPVATTPSPTPPPLGALPSTATPGSGIAIPGSLLGIVLITAAGGILIRRYRRGSVR